MPDPKYPTDQFPGHAAWIDGDWKLHRIEAKGKITWELYNLATDPAEENNVLEKEKARVKDFQTQLEGWLASVVGSLNGRDYESKASN